MSKSKSGKTALALWGATDIGPPHFSADILWRTGFKAPDPFFLVDILDENDLIDFGKSYVLVNPLELERAAKEINRKIEVVNAYDYKNKTRGYLENFLKLHGVKKVIVPDVFPYKLGSQLIKSFEVAAADPPFYPRRAIKADWEIAEIEKAQRAVENAVGKAMNFLARCDIVDENIVDYGQPDIYINCKFVTSKWLRKIIDGALYEQGYLGIDTVVSCGIEASNPHCVGSGPLLARKPIVIDVFPLSLETHYYADMTRTVFKGAPSYELRRMYQHVLNAQEEGMRQIMHGVDAKKIYDWTLWYFDREHYPTNTKNRPMEGFIHGVGHGVGIDIHEAPWISSSQCILQEGNVVTVEPGLYYQEARNHIPQGGIRIEDMVLVTKTGCRNLTQFPKDLESMIIP